MRRFVLGLAVPIAISACSGGEVPEHVAVAGRTNIAADGGLLEPEESDDNDGDGLCDYTERQLGTDPDQADSDRDGMPDFSEVIAGFGPMNPQQPAPDEVGIITASPQAQLAFQLRLTLDGSGQGYTGELSSGVSFDPAGYSAKDFFEGATVRGADPPDNVRGLQAASERFTSVVGKTRLSFELRFRYGLSEPVTCTGSYPFSYRLTDDAGRITSGRNFLLVVAPSSNTGRPPFCVPASCL